MNPLLEAIAVELFGIVVWFIVFTYRNPTALLFKGRQSTPMTAWVCGECGYVELYADDPRALKV